MKILAIAGSSVILFLLGCQQGPNKNLSFHRSPSPIAASREVPAWLSKTPVIPREVLFGPGERMRVRLSPDGKRLSYIAAIMEEGSLKYGIFVTPIQRPEEKGVLILPEASSRFPEYFWTLNGKHIVFSRDVGGNENDQLFLVDIENRQMMDLTQDTQVKVKGISLNPKYPDRVFYYSNRRDPKYFDLYQLDLASHKTNMVFQNDPNFLSLVVNDDLKPRVGLRYDADGGFDVQVYDLSKKTWEKLMGIPFENVPGFEIIGYDSKLDRIFYTDSNQSDTGDLLEMDLTSRKTKVIGHDPKAQIVEAITAFEGGKPLAFLSEYLKPKVTPLSEKFGIELKQLEAKLPKGNVFNVMSQTRDDKLWLLAINGDQKSVLYAIWNRSTRRLKKLFSMKPLLDQQPLVPMHPVKILNRDRLEMVSYLTLPPGLKYNAKSLVPVEKVPMVLLVHGGPWARDSWGLDPKHQQLANRGYAVLSVNYRGSTGFGKKFESLSYGEWGGKMHDDLVDATRWAIDKGIADPQRIAIVGASYGGYATLIGLTFTPEVFAAGIDMVGIANLVTFSETTPEYWKPFLNNSIKRMGADHRTDEGKKFLWQRSPLSKVDQIKKPLLIGHGDNDPRVNIQEAIQITEAMVKKNLPVTLLRFPDEGHGFARPENESAFEAVSEAFLATHLGGRSEPLEFSHGSSVNVAEGGHHVMNLCTALIKASKKGAGCN